MELRIDSIVYAKIKIKDNTGIINLFQNHLEAIKVLELRRSVLEKKNFQHFYCLQDKKMITTRGSNNGIQLSRSKELLSA